MAVCGVDIVNGIDYDRGLPEGTMARHTARLRDRTRAGRRSPAFGQNAARGGGWSGVAFGREGGKQASSCDYSMLTVDVVLSLVLILLLNRIAGSSKLLLLIGVLIFVYFAG